MNQQLNDMIQIQMQKHNTNFRNLMIKMYVNIRLTPFMLAL